MKWKQVYEQDGPLPLFAAETGAQWPILFAARRWRDGLWEPVIIFSDP